MSTRCKAYPSFKTARLAGKDRFSGARLILHVGILAVVIGAQAAAQTEEKDPYKDHREHMVRQDIARSEFWGRTAVKDEDVLQAMRTVLRHEFVLRRMMSLAYSDRPLEIGYGQTISQPYMVAYMTEMLRLDSDDIVLEVGTGSGYQAAVCAEIAKDVYTIEIIAGLHEESNKRFKRLGYKNVHTRFGDGYFGWKEKGPFDAIIVTAAASHIPPPLVEQLKPGARMAIPVGPPFQTQHLMLVEKRNDGKVVQRNVMPVRFVTLTRTPQPSAPEDSEDSTVDKGDAK